MGLFVGIVIGLLILVLLVVVHELGHAIVARRNGVVVEEFGIGMPPRAYEKKLKNGILLTLNWLPLGGFVKLKGEYDSADQKGDYGAATFMQKTRILLAGVLVNWFTAAVLLSVLAVVGLPKVLPNQIQLPFDTTVVSKPVEVTSLVSGGAASKAGVAVGDRIIRFAGTDVTSTSQLIDLTKQNAGQTVDVNYERSGTQGQASVDLGPNDGHPIFGAGLGQQQSTRSTWSAPIVGLATTTQFTLLTFESTGQMIVNFAGGIVNQFSPDLAVRQAAANNLKSVSDSVAGPVGILGTIFPAAEQAGLAQLIFLTAVISLSLAIMNVLPIPALDGGRWFTMAIFRIIKKPLTREREDKIQTVGFLLLMGLTVLVTIADVAKIF